MKLIMIDKTHGFFEEMPNVLLAFCEEADLDIEDRVLSILICDNISQYTIKEDIGERSHNK